ncbi:MAG: ABC transporter ATP-binding protein [Spirochaetaceae bacterium]|nr:MAG: ABC transporter ATP-binding protein [Spirochaetaceae bacterium]
MSLLSVTNINKHFGGLHAVRDVSFSVTKGMIKSIIGPNGAGKTTLFNLLSGEIRPDSGQVQFDGKKIYRLPPYRIATLGISRTYQTTRLFDHMTVLENVMTGAHLMGRAGFFACALKLPWTFSEETAINKKAVELLEVFDLLEFADEVAGELAFGIKRRVEFARACASSPKLLFLDEPAAGLNIYETIELSRLIPVIRDRGLTLLLVEHDMSMVMDLSDEILVLNEGARLVEGLPREIQKNTDVIRVYLGDEQC